MILYIRGFPATDLVKYDGSLDDSYLGIILVQLSIYYSKKNWTNTTKFSVAIDESASIFWNGSKLKK